LFILIAVLVKSWSGISVVASLSVGPLLSNNLEQVIYTGAATQPSVPPG